MTEASGQQTPATPIAVDPALVIQELCSDPMGRALWERAQWRVAADMLQRRVAELERQRPAAATSSGVSDE